MSNIRVDVNYTIKDGSEIVFRSPVDCSQITGLIVYYPGEDENTTSKEFALADAHGNNVGDIDHLFTEDVVVKVILDVANGMAFVQNADTNAYLEGRFSDINTALGGKAPAGYGLGTNSHDRTIYSPAQLDALHNSNGWFLYAGGGTNPILTGDSGNINYAYGRIDVFDSTEAKMTLIPVFSQGHGLTTLERYYCNGVWGEWEWVNPPMTPGVEYRTTERHNGKPVYAYTLPLKTLPNATNNDVEHDIANIDKVISCTGTASDGRTLPFYGKYTKIHLSAIKTAVCVCTETDESSMTGTATIKYTKTTD